jgi:hypothetical protein
MKQFLFIIPLLFAYLTIAQDSTEYANSDSKIGYYKVSKVRIFVNDRSEIQDLRKQGVRFERVKMEDGYFDTSLDSLQIENLKNTGYQHQIIIDDVTKDYLERTKESRKKIQKLKKNGDSPCGKGSFGYGSMGGFYTFDEVVAEMDAMHQLYPNIITAKDSVGSSYQGRPIWTVKISDNPNIDEEEPEVFYNSLIHAREPEGMMAVVYFMYYLLENYGLDPEVTYLVDNRELYFMPVLNPDGYVHNQNMSPEGGGMWRKNLRNVDLNRNFGYMWGYDDIGSSPIQSDETYRGAEAFSESETKAVRDFCNAHNFRICNNYHSYWNVIFTPWSYNLSQTTDSTIFNNTIKLGTQINDLENGNYILDNYSTNGDAIDWMYGEQTTKSKIFAYLTEVGNYDDWFWPIPERIFPLAEENCYLNKILAWGPNVIDNPPFIANANLNSNFCRPLIDTLKISAFESNPDNHTSNVVAKILNSEDAVIYEIQLNQVDSIFSGAFVLNQIEENFYNIILEQNGSDIPSKLFYNNLRFTTAGPLVVNSYNITRIDSNRIFISNVSITNNSQSVAIPLVSVRAKSLNNCIITNELKKELGDVNPQETKLVSEGYFFDLNDCTKDSVEIAFAISSGEFTYWESRVKVEIPPLINMEGMNVAIYDNANDLTNWDSYGWGTTTENYVSAPSSFTDSPNGNYPTNTTTRLTLANQVKLINVLNAFLEFDSQWFIEAAYDYGQVQISTDNGVHWTALNGQYTIPPGVITLIPYSEPIYSGEQSSWVHEIIDISKYASKQFKLRFLLKSDYMVNMDGWYVDNIKISSFTNIHAEQPFLDKMYARKEVDSVLFRIKLLDLHDHQFTPKIHFSNRDNTDIDSLTLFDDGLHGDLFANDNLYGNFITPRTSEGLYSIDLTTIDHQTNDHIQTESIFNFTTIPLVIDSIQANEISDFRFVVKPFLKNAGTDQTISRISVAVTTDDPWVTEVSPEIRNCYNLDPGQCAGVTQPYVVSYDSASFPGYFNLKFKIYSEGIVYWEDSITVSEGLTNIEDAEKLPNQFQLSQNYPNPFNPSTLIKYALPSDVKRETKNVKLIVYDILGREVAALVNQKQKPGFYKTVFDASGLTSGIYFYRLLTNDPETSSGQVFIDTKKMILMK